MMHRPVPLPSQRHARARQRGLSLIFSLIGLAVLALAAVALVRSIDTGTLVLGNIGFKQDATATTDQGVDQAVAWLTGNVAGTVLNGNASGYVAADIPLLDPTGNNSSLTTRTVIDWDGSGNCSSYTAGTFSGCQQPAVGTDVNGNQIKYLIVRLCPTAGAPNTGGNDCAAPLGLQGEGDGRGSLDYRKYERFASTTPGGAYYRIIVRALGGKNAASFTETVVHF